MIERKWQGQAAILAATGPSLTEAVAIQCREAHSAGTHRIGVVNDAYRLFPNADLLYACDAAWWEVHKGAPGFKGEKWTSQSGDRHPIDKRYLATKYGLNIIRGRYADGFSDDPNIIHFGANSGFQLLNVALLMGANPIILVGYNMRHVGGKRHFFGDHPRPLSNASNFEKWAPNFAKAAKTLAPDIRIINATPDSAITCFERMDLQCALFAGYGKERLSGNGLPNTIQAM